MGQRDDRRLARKKQEMRRQKRRKKRRRRVVFLVAEILILCILSVIAYGMFKLDKLNVNPLKNLTNNGISQDGYMNVAIFGDDRRPEDTGNARSDCIIIASINNDTKEVKLVSVYRDTLLNTEDDTYDKANSAYAVGGAEAAVNMLNRNLDLNIQDYVSVNFLAVADVVDLLGGIDLDLTDEEVVHMNNYCVETSEITGKKYKKIEPEVAGTYHLNGVQAVSYSRIRYTEGGDFQRTSRQRLVIEKIAEEAKKADLSTINKIIDAVFPEITTSFTSGEIVKMSAGLLQYSIGDNEGFPMDNETPDSIPGYQGSYVVPKGLEENVIKLHKFLFPDEDYTPTDTLKEISDHIKDVTGIYPDDSEDSTEDNEE